MASVSKVVDQPLSALNRSSARLASFTIRVCCPHVSQYSYQSKRNQQMVTAFKFEAWLVGNNPGEYCLGFVKGSEAEYKRAQTEFPDQSVWSLSRVCLDTYTAPGYISSPLPIRVELKKSTMTAQTNKEILEMMPLHPVPPRSVADVAQIRTDRSTDLVALVKEVSQIRQTKKGDEVMDVTLLDGSQMTGDALATIVVSVFGKNKMHELSNSVGAPMAFFNLSVRCANGAPSIVHHEGELLKPKLDCQKMKELSARAQELLVADRTQVITAVWTPSSQARDVTGPQPLSCAAFLDYTTETPNAKLPEVMQLMWVHLEEPEAESSVLDGSGERIWYLSCLRDLSGSAHVGVPQRSALMVSGCPNKEGFLHKHSAGELNTPLLCHARVSRSVKPNSGGLRGAFVNHVLESIEPVSWDPASAPNASYVDVLAILKNCPAHDAGIVFAYLSDLKQDPFYGIRVCYSEQGSVDNDGASQPVADGPRGAYIVALIGSPAKSLTEQVGDDAYKVSMSNIRDVANPKGSPEDPVGDYKVMGYCSMNNLSGFRLDPPRGKTLRIALAFFSKANDDGSLVLHKLEYIEADQMKNAVCCMQRLRRLSSRVRSSSFVKRSHSVDLESSESAPAPSSMKKARTLQAAPTAGSLPEARE